jgi:hypothetical protein
MRQPPCLSRPFPLSWFHHKLGWLVTRGNMLTQSAIRRCTKVCLFLDPSAIFVFVFGGNPLYRQAHQLHTLSKRATGVSAVDRTPYERAPSCPHTLQDYLAITNQVTNDPFGSKSYQLVECLTRLVTFLVSALTSQVTNRVTN